MSDAARHVLLLVPMLWVGMVIAISFLETPLKFRAPGVTLQVGLGIGRLVFKALNIVEIVLLLMLLTALYAAEPPAAALILLALVAVVLLIQVAVIRPPLSKRSDRVLAGATLPRSRLHWVYVALEIVKVGLLIGLAVNLAAAVVKWTP